MKAHTKNRALIIGFSLAVVSPIYVSHAESLGEALVSGTASANVRYRIEDVDQANLSEDSFASTLRTRLGYKTKAYKGVSFFVGIDDVTSIGNANYLTPSSGPVGTPIGPKNAGHPVIADPLESDLNELYVSYTGEKTTATIGRQRIIRANSRFVGNVGWRQHEQTYEGISIKSDIIEDFSIFAAYLTKRHTITFTDIDQDTTLFDVEYKGFDSAVLSAYYYDIQVDNTTTQWQNFGARLTVKLNKFGYIVEYAQQDNQAGETPHYTLLEGTYGFAGVALTAGMETLGNDKTTSFATPLATLHKFNGWADVFLATPTQGLQDTYVKVAGKLADINLQAVYHTFDSDTQSIDFGNELNVSATKKINDHLSLGAKYADYSAGDARSNKVSTDKLWLWADASF